MLDIFRGLKSLIRVNHLHIDSSVFRLHYSITVAMLIAFSLIITTRQYVGNPIDCIHNKEIPEDVFNTFCWIHSTFTISANSNNPPRPAQIVDLYGDGKEKTGIATTVRQEDKKVYRYYQWVCFCLFFQVSITIIQLIIEQLLIKPNVDLGQWIYNVSIFKNWVIFLQ